MLGLGALFVGLRSVRRTPDSTRTGQRAWLMLGLMLPHVSLAWMHLEIPLTHAFVSVLSFGWVLWMGQNGMGWSVDDSIHAVTWFFGMASTMLVIWTIRVVFAPSLAQQQRKTDDNDLNFD